MQEQVQTLVDAGRLKNDIGEKISLLEPGVFCLHKSWGPGVIKEWDLFGDKIIIDFDGKPAHSMKLQFAANSLEVLDVDHIRALVEAEAEVTPDHHHDHGLPRDTGVLDHAKTSRFLPSIIYNKIRSS